MKNVRSNLDFSILFPDKIFVPWYMLNKHIPPAEKSDDFFWASFGGKEDQGMKITGILPTIFLLLSLFFVPLVCHAGEGLAEPDGPPGEQSAQMGADRSGSSAPLSVAQPESDRRRPLVRWLRMLDRSDDQGKEFFKDMTAKTIPASGGYCGGQFFRSAWHCSECLPLIGWPGKGSTYCGGSPRRAGNSSPPWG